MKKRSYDDSSAYLVEGEEELGFDLDEKEAAREYCTELTRWPERRGLLLSDEAEDYNY
jgi:hypothetical protein